MWYERSSKLRVAPSGGLSVGGHAAAGVGCDALHRWRAALAALTALAWLVGAAPARGQSAEAPGRPAECIDAAAAAVAPRSEGVRDNVPDGLAPSDWSSIRAAYEAGRHAVSVVDGVHRARNPGQGWAVRFDGRGFEAAPEGARGEPGSDGSGPGSGGWTWGLELIGYGREGSQRAVSGAACIEAEGQRVSYRWDNMLTEWFINDPRGVEHGYTVNERPEGAGPLRIELAVRGGLLPRVSEDGCGVVFAHAGGGAVVNYAGLKVFGADGKAAPARFEATGAGLVLTVDDGGSRYPLTIDPVAQQAYLKASNTGAYDHFGQSVAISGDTVVVGAYGEGSDATGVNGNQFNNRAEDSGAAYVFVRDGSGNWSQQAYLKASNTGAYDYFGQSVAISGDTVVVGAYGEDSNARGVNGNQSNNSAADSGAAYVFVRDGSGNWSQQAYLKASNTDAGDQFGSSVAISGETVVVGALGEDSSATGVNGNQADNSTVYSGSGAAYVFVRDGGGNWSQQAYLKASNTNGLDYFGYFVAISGNTVAVGAHGEDSNATGVNGDQSDNSAGGSGAVYVFVRDGSGNWRQQAYLKASNTGAGDTFGWSVAISGDTAVVGAIWEDSNAIGVNGDQSNNSASDSGAAYVFVRDGSGNWSQRAYLKASNTDATDNFGRSVAISGDTVLVGAPGEGSNTTGVNGNQADNSQGGSGAAYVFTGIGTCAADFNGDTSVDDFDFFDFLNAFNASDMSADFNGDTSVDDFDYFDFLNAFFAGC